MSGKILILPYGYSGPDNYGPDNSRIMNSLMYSCSYVATIERDGYIYVDKNSCDRSGSQTFPGMLTDIANNISIIPGVRHYEFSNRK